MIRFFCKSCYFKIRVEDGLAGKKLKCPKCKAVNFVPASAAAPAGEDDALDAPALDALQIRPEQEVVEEAPPRIGAGSGLPLDDVTSGYDDDPPASPLTPVADEEDDIPLAPVAPGRAAPAPPRGGDLADLANAAQAGRAAGTTRAQEPQAPLAELAEARTAPARTRLSRRHGAAGSRQKILVAVIVGVLVVGGIVAGVLIFGGDKKPPPKPAPSAAPPSLPPARTANVVAPPVLSEPPRKISKPLQVRITCETYGVALHYTVEGAEPTLNSPRTKGAVTVPPGTTLRVRAFREDWVPSLIVSAQYARAAVTLADVKVVRGRARAGWAKLVAVDGGQGLDAMLAKGKQLLTQAEKDYGAGAYAKAREAFDEAEALAQRIRLIDDARSLASESRKQARAALVDLEISPPAGGKPAEMLAQARKECAVAEADFAKGKFDDARGMWTSARALAGKIKSAIDSDQAFGPWEKLCEQIAPVYDDMFVRLVYDRSRFVSHQAITSALLAALPADEAPFQAVHAAARKVLDAMKAFDRADQTYRLARDAASQAQRKVYERRLKRDIESFAAAFQEMIAPSSRPLSAKIRALLDKAAPQAAKRDRCPWCKDTGLMFCRACLDHGLPTGKATCPVCGGKTVVPCPTCGGKGSVLCPKCRGRRLVPNSRGKTTTCPQCNGTGYVHYRDTKLVPGRCPTCTGNVPNGTVPCTKCRRSGRFGDCPVCGGTKKVPCTHCDEGKKRAAARATSQPGAGAPLSPKANPLAP